MADTKIDKSLDDIIKERNIRSRMPRGGGGMRGRGGPGGRPNPNGPNRFRGGANNGNRFGRRSGGAVQKRRSGGPGPNNSPRKAAAAASVCLF